MFSGEDSSGEGVNALNPFGQFQLASQSAAACGLKTTTTSSGSIDWASLAQQWIQMRDFSGADINTTMPDAPPPPNISGDYPNENRKNGSETQSMKVALIHKRTRFDEQGEADMEMDDDEDNARIEYKNVQHHPNVAATQILQPNWVIPQASPVSTGNDIDANPQQQVSAHWNPWPPRVLLPPVPILRENTNPTAHIPSLMKINISDPNVSQNKLVPGNHNEINSITTMDAAKRKILPAWIREGLEKMEREKQKQLEKQPNPHDLADDASFDRVTTLSNQHMVNSKVLTHLDSDNSSCYEDEDDNDRVVTIDTAAHTIKNEDSPLSSNVVEILSTQKEPMKTGKSYEQKLSDLMIVVRRTLTELLLEVTNQEISNVVNETIKSHKTKATTAHVIPKSAISTITGKLGLAAYDDSSSDSSESEAVESINEICVDSEEEIRATIRTKRKAFSKTSEEIEERIAESALQEEQKLKYYLEQDEEQQKLKIQIEQENQFELERDKSSSSGKGPTTYTSGKGYEKEFGETSQSKLQLSNGKRQKDRTTRFSDNKDSRGATIVTAADYISHYKCSQLETAAQKINSVVLHMPADASSRTSTEITFKSMDAADTSALQTVQESLGKSSRGKSYKKKHRKSSNHSSDNNDSNSDFDSSDTSNTSHSSSKLSRSSSMKYKSHRNHQISSSTSTRKSNRDRSREMYNDGPKSSRRKYRSSDSDDYGDDKYSSRKYHRHRFSHHSDYRHERKSARSRSRSHSRSRSSYSSRRRH